jgi:hypothetical protein
MPDYCRLFVVLFHNLASFSSYYLFFSKRLIVHKMTLNSVFESSIWTNRHIFQADTSSNKRFQIAAVATK